MIRIVTILALSLILPISLYSQDFSISGIVISEMDSVPVPGASVSVAGQVHTTDIKGHFSFASLPDSICSVTISHLGHHTLTLDSISISSAPQIIVLIRPPQLCEGIEDRARLDLANGHVYLYFEGFAAVRQGSYESKRLALERKYGFERIERGCTEMCADRYNAIVRIYLDQRNGPGWWQRYWQELKAINN
jgi:hypothetical protein